MILFPRFQSAYSIPVVETLLLGWGQNTDNLHSPNERFSLESFRQGILASALFRQELAEIQV